MAGTPILLELLLLSPESLLQVLFLLIEQRVLGGLPWVKSAVYRVWKLAMLIKLPIRQDSGR